MSRLNVAIIGLGKMGIVHTCILKTMPNIDIVALCDKTYSMRKIAKKIFRKSIIVDDVSKLDGLSIDCAYVTVPIPAHLAVASSLFSQNITSNIFIEKTLSSSLEESKKLCELSNKNPSVNMVGYMKRFGVTFRKAKSMLEQEVLGDQTSFKAFAYSSDFADRTHNISGSASRGGALSDLGSHIIDLTLWLLGDFEVDKSSIKLENNQRFEDSAFFEVKNGQLKGQFDVSWTKPNYRMPNFGLQIQGNNGKLIVNDYSVVFEPINGKKIVWYKTQLNDNVPFLLGDPEYYREDDYYIKSLLSKQTAEPNFVIASKVDKVISEVRTSV
jgi:predicted dehydrogenase